MTISDVAKLAGVSKSTVSAVLNNKDVVSESTRRAVLRAMDELHYRPRASARRGMAAPTERFLSVVIKEARNPFYPEVLAGIQEVADEKGYLISVGSSEGRYTLERQLVRHGTEQDAQGFIIFPVLSDDTDLSHLYELKRSKIPFVVMESIRGIGTSLIEVDNVLLSCAAVRHLIAEGHTRIAHFAGPRYSQHTQERIEGVRRAFSESHLVFDEAMIASAGSSLESGYRAGMEVFGGNGSRPRPTAVTCYNDLVAIGLLRALRELGLDVPGDVSVIGFDDLQVLDYLPVPLTTVRVSRLEMGRRAAEMVIRQIEAGRELPAERVLMEAELVVRASTRPPALVMRP